MIIRNKAELEAQIKNGDISQSDADFLRVIYEQHEQSNSYNAAIETKTAPENSEYFRFQSDVNESADEAYARFAKECSENGICSEDIETAWKAIKIAKYRKNNNVIV